MAEMCALCHQGDAVVTPEGIDFNVACPRCGTYRVNLFAREALGQAKYNPEHRLRLTWAARRASDMGSPLNVIPEELEEIAQSVVEPSPPHRKLDELLLVMGRRTDEIGKGVRFQDSHDWPAVYARNEQEFASLRAKLTEWGYAQPSALGLQLTQTGWERLAEIEAMRPKSTAAFVAMRFNDEMKPAYDDGFKPCLLDLGYVPIRADREHYLGKIDDFIIASIRKSALVVADFTHVRTGVFFEAGLGLGLGIPVVWTCREDWLPKLGEHFDTRQYNHLPWTTPVDLRKALRLRIEATVFPRPKPRVEQED